VANKILVARGMKARIEAIKSTLATNELVYAVDTGELGVKKANGSVEYFMNAADINAIVDALENSKVDKVAGKGLSTNDYTDADKSKVDSIDAKDADTLQAAKDYADDRISEEITAEKVKQLYEANPDTNAFTDAEKAKLAGIEEGAQVNTVSPEDLDADNIRFDDSNTGLLTGITRVQRAIEELDRQLVNTGEFLIFLFYELYDKVEAIEDGTAVVKKAEQDEDGNNIKDTYATLADLATDYYSKTEIDDMIGDIDTALANILGV